MDISRRLLLGAATAGTAALSLSKAARAATTPAAPLLGPAPGVARLGLNENPYGPAPSAIAAMRDAMTSGSYYPGEGIQRLMAMIAERHNVTPDHVLVSSGSGEILNAIGMAYGSKGTLVSTNLFWDAYFKYAEDKGVKTVRVPMKPDFSHDFAAMEAAITPETTLISVCNPNNPTGILETPQAIHAFAKSASAKTTVLIDEAYIELTTQPVSNSVIDLIRSGHNIAITRTFSKIYGMAGIRVGYVISTPANIAKIRPYVMGGMNCIGLAGAVASYNDEAFLSYSRSKVTEAREMVNAAVKSAGLTSLPSVTNFVWVNVGMNANIVRDRMAAKKILIRGVYGAHTNWSRVSMGKIEDVARYCKALPECLGA
jgi:histidinol-phosphate aminotransferase